MDGRTICKSDRFTPETFKIRFCRVIFLLKQSPNDDLSPICIELGIANANRPYEHYTHPGSFVKIYATDKMKFINLQ